MYKKLLAIILIIMSLFMLTSCKKGYKYFTDKQLNKFGLSGLKAPDNTSNYYSEVFANVSECYMIVKSNDDVRNFVLELLNRFEDTSFYKEYGYTKSDDMFSSHRNIYLSKNIEDYLLNSRDYYENGVSFNAYYIYYSFYNEANVIKFYEIHVSSYTSQDNIYLEGYNLRIAISSRLYSNYTIVTE